MPARKSNASIASDEPSGLSVEDLNLPKTMVNRLAKGALPANFNVQSVAQSAISKSATVFVNYLTAHASDIAARQNKKTIQPNDVLEALRELEFEMFVKRTNEELIKYTEIQCTKRNTYRRRVKDEKRAQGESGDASVMGPDGSMMSAGDDGAEPASVMAGGSGSNGAVAGMSNATNGHAAAGAEPAAKRARMDADAEDDEQDGDGEEGEGEGEDDEEEGQDEDEDEDEEEEDDADEGEREDLLEEKEEREEEDEAMDGEESD